MSLPRRAGRTMLAASFISGGVNQILKPAKVSPASTVSAPIAKRVPQLPSDPESLVRMDGAIKIAGGLGLIFGPFARPAALLLAGSLVPTTLTEHRFWGRTDPARKVSDRADFFTNVSLIGGLLITALDTGGRPSVPWVAGKAARGAAGAVGETAVSVGRGFGSVAGAVAGTAGALGSVVASGATKARSAATHASSAAKAAAAETGGSATGVAQSAKEAAHAAKERAAEVLTR
jgi:putative oxidoreductase